VPPARRRRVEPLPFSPPLIGEDDIAEVVATLRSPWITTGPKTRAFADDFAREVGAPAALAVSSCTAAMHVALAAKGIGPGDLVYTTPMTFCSTVHVIEQVGATPVLVDIDPETLNIDPDRLDEAIGRGGPGRPAAVMPVHFAGHPCDLEPLRELARRHDLFVLEDAAHALPARYREAPIGSVAGDVDRAVAFSFYATKNLTTAEGGMLTGSPELIEEARIWSLHGMSRDAWKRYENAGSWYYEVVRPGFKYNMTDIAAALGIHQLGRIGEIRSRRADLAERYTKGFADLEEVEVPAERAGVSHAWHLYVLRLHLDRLTIDRGRFIDELGERLIGTSVHFIPVHLHPYYRDRYGWLPEDLPVALEQFHRLVSLPLHLHMTDDDVDDVVDAVRDVVDAARG
jgi:dTDP-4-amino-4,6-dideoxygalactose transaminase